MPGQNPQKVGIKTAKELTDEVNILKNENRLLAEHFKELDKIVRYVVHSEEELRGLQEVPKATKTFKRNTCEQTFPFKKALKSKPDN